MMEKKFLKNMEWWIVVWSIALCIIGLVALFSATSETEHSEFNKQIIWIVVSLCIMFVTMMIDYNIIVKISPILYIISIILLIVVLFTERTNGATSWFEIGDFKFQPAEFSKIFVIAFLAFTISKLQEKGKEEINNPLKLLLLLIIIAIPVALIVKQPDYGTATAYIFAITIMLFTSGINKKYIIGTILIISIALPLLYIYVLPNHAKSRIEVFLNPESDPRGAGYNIIQSKLAIGAGELTGMGILKRKPNPIRLFISKNNRLYIFCDRRRNGIYSFKWSNNIKCIDYNKSSVYR